MHSLAHARKAHGPGPWVAACLAVALGSGCTLDPTPPGVEGIEPEWGYNGENTEVEIRGEHFFPTIVVTEAAEAGARVEGAFDAWLEGVGDPVELTGVHLVTHERLGAEVPPGLEPGLYDLRVRVPSGLDTVLEDAFTVTDTRADHLFVKADDPSWTVGQMVILDIAVLDPSERTVPQALLVEVRAEPDEPGLDTIAFVEFGDEHTLADQEPLADGVGVRGTLDRDGTGIVSVTSTVESDVTFVVTPVYDTVVREARETVSFEPGPVNTVELTLPRSPFNALAGDPFHVGVRFLDAWDNVLYTEQENLRLSDLCLNNGLPVFPEITGEGTLEITMTKACATNVLYVEAFGEIWQTESFSVLPNVLDGYAVTVGASEVSAGQIVGVNVRAVDWFDNAIPGHAADLRLYDNVGGVDSELGYGTPQCGAFDAATGEAFCTVNPWIAGDAVVISVVDEAQYDGEGNPIVVTAGTADHVVVLVDAETVEAGQPFEVRVRLDDQFGNSVPFDPGTVTITDDTGTIDCTWAGSLDGAQSYTCTVEGATPDADVTATIGDLSTDDPDPLVVTNGPLADVEVEPQGTSFTAGTAFTLALRGYDAYGNAYVVQTDPVVDLDDTGHDMRPTSATLGPLGTVEVSAVLYTAGENVKIYALQGGARLGASRALHVGDAGLDGIEIEVAPWVSVDEPADVTVTAVDAFGNAVEDYSGSVTLSARGGACETVGVTSFEEGVADVALDCDVPTLSEVLLAVDDAQPDIEGESGVVDVVDLECSAGPTAALTLDGDTESLQCLPSGGSVEVTADTSGSTPGAASIVLLHFVDGETETRTLSDSTTLTYAETGIRQVEALVVDNAACADLAEATVYVGADDGEPTGVVDVSLSAASPRALLDTVTVDVQAWDCTGDLAAHQDLVVRADLGDPAGTSSGEGLLVTLDATGAGSFTWDFRSTRHAGEATIHIGSVGGGAYGSGGVTVQDDVARPEIVTIDPSGATSALVDTIEVVFTDPMRPSSMTATYIPLTGPGGAISGAYSMSADARTLTITPTTPLDGAAGAYTLALNGVRDAASGNQLDGDWTDGPDVTYTHTFGAVASALPVVTSCEADRERFTPDGDDGASEEADVVSVTMTATSSPSWWWLEVLDRDGERVRSARQPGVDTAVAWDGRGDDGLVAPCGAYRLRVRAIDTFGNVGEACDVTVELDQHVDAP